ncbi:hypothetical protein EYZ11_008435 [Aspergillus tanneri]|uniref:Major facilitator superfamily (MFS) profile domain-containing protein n=1 Tax=Aspergillus tanneri TaxID=1220188 RepID=A0A4S3JAH2_9EURO|nr:hypothetical protein EYZ11_008435 [Aspergillus tanneri]
MSENPIREVDRRLIPILFGTWVSSIFYFGYFAWEMPTNLLIPRVPVAKYLTINTIFWGIVVTLTAVCVDVHGLLTLRFLLGVAEATITPAFMFITTTWYTREEIPIRTAIWFSGNSIGGLLGSLLAYALGHITSPLHPWQWMYLILGIATTLWALVIFVFLPDCISSARFLTPSQRSLMTQRVLVAGTGRTEETHWSWSQTTECLRDPKTPILLALSLLTQIPNGGVQNFSNLVLTSFGFSPLQTALLNIPTSLISTAAITLSGWIAGRVRHTLCLLIGIVAMVSVTGSALVYSRENLAPGVQLLGYFLLATGPATLPLTMTLVQANYRGVTKKMTMTGLMFVVYCVGNIAGPHLFRAREAPVYQTSFRAILVCYLLVVALAALLRVYLTLVNRTRDRVEGIGGAVEDAQDANNKTQSVNQVMEIQLREQDYEDRTDWEIVRFRYRL